MIQWGADDIKAPLIGAKGSKTAVIRVFPPGKSTRKCKQVSDAEGTGQDHRRELQEGRRPGGRRRQEGGRQVRPAQAAGEPLRAAVRGHGQGAGGFRPARQGPRRTSTSRTSTRSTRRSRRRSWRRPATSFQKKALEDMLAGMKATEPAFQGEVWVVAEHSDGVVHPATFELTGKARELADSLETKVGVCIAGENVAHMAEELIAAGADNVYAIEHELLEEFDPTAYRKAIADAIDKYVPQIVLYAATPQGRMLAPMVSYRTGCGLTADCTGLDIRDSSRKGEIGLLLQTRPALGGNVMATIRTKGSKSPDGDGPARRDETPARRPLPQGQDRPAQGRADRRRRQPRNHQDGAGPRAGQPARRRHRLRRQGHAEPRQLREARRPSDERPGQEARYRRSSGAPRVPPSSRASSSESTRSARRAPPSARSSTSPWASPARSST